MQKTVVSRVSENPKTPYGTALKIIRDARLEIDATDNADAFMAKIIKTYREDEVIRAADAVLRFGVAALHDAILDSNI